MQTVIGASVAQQRFAASLLSLFALLAVCLAAVGIYGVVSHSVGRRNREIGIRMALGAEPVEVLRLVVRGSLLLVALGIAGGIAVGLAASRLISSLLFGVPSATATTVNSASRTACSCSSRFSSVH